jgi:hypothetical protein
MTLDDNAALENYINAAVRLGFTHVASGKKRLSGKALLDALDEVTLDGLKLRNYHVSILTNAYGFAFRQQYMQKLIAKKGAAV